MELVSVIIPVYNSEKYIKRAIESVLKQTYKNLEIILIDDASNDNSYEICKEYEFIDNRIIVIKHNNNQGLGGARNTGLNIAKGEWVFFLDSDDFIEDSAIETLYNIAVVNKVDISICYFNTFYNKDNIQFYATQDDLKLSGKYNSKVLIEWMYRGGYTTGFCVVAWNKLYNKHVFKNIRFKNIIHEDEDIIFKIYMEDYNIFITNKPLYYYSRENKDSIMQRGFSEKNLIYLDILYDRNEILKTNNMNDLYYKNMKLYCNMTIEYYYKIMLANKMFDFNEYLKKYIKILNKSLTSSNLSIKDKLRFIFFYLNKTIYKKIFLISGK